MIIRKTVHVVNTLSWLICYSLGTQTTAENHWRNLKPGIYWVHEAGNLSSLSLVHNEYCATSHAHI